MPDMEVKKYLDYEGLKLYDEKIKALIKQHGDNVTNILNLLGELPEDAEEETILAYLENKIKEVDDKIGDISELTGDTLKDLAAVISAEIERATDAEDGLDGRVQVLEEALGLSEEGEEGAPTILDRIEALENDTTDADAIAALEEKLYGNSEDENDLGDIGDLAARLDVLEGEGEGSVKKAAADATADAIAQLISDSEENPIDEKFDTLKEIADWILASDENAEGLNAAERLNALEEAVGVPSSAEVSHEATQEDVDAGKAENVGDKIVDKEAVSASGLNKKIEDLDKSTDSRLDVIEAALGLEGVEGDDSLADRIQNLEDEVASFQRITESEIEALFDMEINDEETAI